MNYNLETFQAETSREYFHDLPVVSRLFKTVSRLKMAEISNFMTNMDTFTLAQLTWVLE